MEKLKREPIRILWAIDIADTPADLLVHAKEFFRGVFERSHSPDQSSDVIVTPVYVISDRPGMDSELEASGSPVDSAKRALKRMADSATFPAENLTEPEVLVASNPHVSGSARCVSEFGMAQRYSCIVVSSHGRKGIGRLALGSFAEALLDSSSVPTIVLGRHSTPSERSNYDQVLFSTDLSEESKAAFYRFIPLARMLRSNLRLYHAMATGADALRTVGFAGGLL
jgi:nucleotide-binding universal stress UspA family protein